MRQIEYINGVKKRMRMYEELPAIFNGSGEGAEMVAGDI